MKKPLKALFAALLPVTLVLSAFFAACADEHEHTLESVPAVAATCTQDGNIAYWHCADCNKYFEDEEASKEITLADTVTAKLGHGFPTRRGTGTSARAATPPIQRQRTPTRTRTASATRAATP